MFDNITFTADEFASRKREAGNAWRTSEGKADNFSRTALAGLVTDTLSPMTLAISVYDEMEPKNGNGKACAPKESEKAPCGISVSSLRNAKGGEGARSCLEAIFYVAENASHDSEAVADFILNKRNAFKLFPLKRHLQAMKAKAAKAEADALASDGDAVEPKADMEEAVTANPLTEALAFLNGLDGEALIAHEADIEALLTACRDASDKLAAVETLRTGTEG